MNLEELLLNHSELRKQILEYFDYDEYWRIFPLIDLTDVYWAYDGPHIIYLDQPITKEILREGRHVEASYYWADETINRYKYEKEDYTLFVLKNHLDLTPSLSIFSNDKRMDLKEGQVVRK